jgi:CHAT domain-containing protein/tetratricopeptide (TPR) repeat protein
VAGTTVWNVSGFLRATRVFTGLALLVCLAALPSPTVSQDTPPGTPPSWYAEGLEQLKTLRADARRLAEAEQAARSLLATVAERLGADTPEALEVRSLLARTLMDIGKKRAPEAASLGQESLASAERQYGRDDYRLRQPLSDLGNALEYSGSFVESKEVRLRLLALCEANADRDDACTGSALADLGMTARQLGDYAESRLYLERSLAAHEARRTDARVDIGQVLWALSGVCRQEGDIDQALVFTERAAKALEGTSPRFYYVALGQLAGIYRELGRYAESRDLLDRCIQEWRKTMGEESPTVATALSNQARAMSKLGEREAALAQAQRALDMYAKRVGPDDRTLSPFLKTLAQVHIDAGKDAQAEPLLENALRVKELGYGTEHDSLAPILDLLAGVEYRLGQYSEAVEHALRAESIARGSFHDVTTILSERQAYRYEASRVSSLRYALSALGRTSPAPAAGLIGRVWDDVVRSRALVLDEIASRTRAAAELRDPGIGTVARDLRVAKSRLSALALSGSQGAGSGALTGAQARVEQLERDLAGRSAEYRRGIARRETRWADVQAALPKGSALLAYIEFDRITGSGGALETIPSYGAFVLPAASSEPQFHLLGTSADIEPRIQAWKDAASRALSGREPLMGAGEKSYRNAGRLLREKIWDPLVPSLKDAQRIFIVPDGAVQLVNIATLPVGEDRYLIESEPLLHHLSTERDLVRRTGHQYASKGALIMGAPDLDAPLTAAVKPAARAAAQTASSGGTGAAPESSSLRGPAPDSAKPRSSAEPACDDFRSVQFPPLPASRAELKDVATIVNPRFQALELTGAAATEAAFKRLAPGRRILHIATHGFFLQDRCASALESARQQGTSNAMAEDSPSFRGAADNPLLLSGLVLTGANHRSARPAKDTQTEDGMLTAEEVGALDLSGTEWAVLSACETGVGKVLPGEGVLGLRRAFAVAGAGTLIMSLWRVDDQATRQWMKDLYERRLAGRSTADAVRDASLAMIQKNRDRGRTTHPFFWGGFVAEGDWR